jgi:hypothetical protein
MVPAGPGHIYDWSEQVAGFARVILPLLLMRVNTRAIIVECLGGEITPAVVFTISPVGSRFKGPAQNQVGAGDRVGELFQIAVSFACWARASLIDVQASAGGLLPLSSPFPKAIEEHRRWFPSDLAADFCLGDT